MRKKKNLDWTYEVFKDLLQVANDPEAMELIENVVKLFKAARKNRLTSEQQQKFNELKELFLCYGQLYEIPPPNLEQSPGFER